MSIATEIARLQQAKADIKEAIQDKGVTVPSSALLDTYDDYIAQIQQGGGGGGNPTAASKDVNFIDYDGTIRYSYTAAEFAQLTALPANPSHPGLTAQGWNWTLADAKAYVATYGFLDIGQMYVTSDGKTRIYIHLDKGRLSPMLGCCPNGTVVVDWGDGSATETLTGTSLSTVKWTNTHTYTAGGDYIITLTVTGSMAIVGESGDNAGCRLLRYGSSGDNRNYTYRDCIYKVEIGTGVTTIGNYAFKHCRALQTVTIPQTVTSFNTYVFHSCYSLKSVTVPTGITSIGERAFYNCNTLWSVSIPDSVTSLGSYFFYYAYSLYRFSMPRSLTYISQYFMQTAAKISRLIIPAGVTELGGYAFSACYGMENVHFLSTTPPTITRNSFSSYSTDMRIYVPSSALSSYQGASNWSYFSSILVGE